MNPFFSEVQGSHTTVFDGRLSASDTPVPAAPVFPWGRVGCLILDTALPAFPGV